MNNFQEEISKINNKNIYNNFQKYIYEVFDDLIFVQNRYGKWWKIIQVYKIRTMQKDAELRLNIEEFIDGNRPKDDDRLIPSRKRMRKYGIDELPQIINIIKWDMNFFGARPISEKYKQLFDKYDFDIRTMDKPWIFWSYTFFDRANKNRSSRQSANIYAKLLNKYKSKWWIDLYKFHIYTLFQNIKAIIKWVNK